MTMLNKPIVKIGIIMNSIRLDHMTVSLVYITRKQTHRIFIAFLFQII